MAKAVIGIVSKHFLRDYKRTDVIAIQFHPETLYKFDKNVFKVLKYFVEVSFEKKNS